MGPKLEILEVLNANKLYADIHQFNPANTKNFLTAHRLLMSGLILDAGKLRSTNVGVLKGTRVSHVAPPHKQVPQLIENLFIFFKKDKEIHPLIKAAIMHYEIEFIHPFTDGNGRMGRFWQTLILTKYHPLFEFIPTESIIKSKQSKYYLALEQSDKSGSLNHFIEFSLSTILLALNEFYKSLKIEPMDAKKRIETAKEHFNSKKFTRSEYLALFKTLSTATASRDLSFGVKNKFLLKTGDRRLTSYLFT